jgi:hypothetical protein
MMMFTSRNYKLFLYGFWKIVKQYGKQAEKIHAHLPFKQRFAQEKQEYGYGEKQSFFSGSYISKYDEKTNNESYQHKNANIYSYCQELIVGVKVPSLKQILPFQYILLIKFFLKMPAAGACPKVISKYLQRTIKYFLALRNSVIRCGLSVGPFIYLAKPVSNRRNTK